MSEHFNRTIKSHVSCYDRIKIRVMLRVGRLSELDKPSLMPPRKQGKQKAKTKKNNGHC